MRSFTSKAGWVVAALLGITLLAAWAGVISAGTLDPPGPLGPSHEVAGRRAGLVEPHAVGDGRV